MADNIEGVGLMNQKFALVTGGASGIGKRICHVLAREGATVAAVDINKQGLEDLLKELPGSGHKAFCTDVSSSSQVNELPEKLKNTFKEWVPNVVVCCAGTPLHSTFEECKEEDYDKVMAVNLKGTFLVIQVFGKCMIEANVKDGSIIAISSVTGVGGIAGAGVYAASKAGQVALIKSAAKEWASIPIRCNCISPGPIHPPKLHLTTREKNQKVIEQVPLGRMGTAEEVAQTVMFLASDRSSFITGANIPVSGGMFM